MDFHSSSILFPTGYCSSQIVTCSVCLRHLPKQRGMRWSIHLVRLCPLLSSHLSCLPGLQQCLLLPGAKMLSRSLHSCFAGLVCFCSLPRTVYHSSVYFYLTGFFLRPITPHHSLFPSLRYQLYFMDSSLFSILAQI